MVATAPPELSPVAVPGRGRHRAPAPPVPRAVTSFWVHAVPLMLLALGGWMRVFQWYAGRSLWLDEALIARSLVSRDYVGLLSEPLQGDQAAPVLWLWATRLSLDLFGDGERALRLVPLLAGLLALGLTWLLARRLLPPTLVPVAVAVAVLSPTLLYFSNEVKPYSLDVAVVLALVLLALRVPAGSGIRLPMLVFTLVGVVAVWASFAAVFALAGLSLLLVLSALRRGGLRRAVPAAALLSGWVLSLGIAYVTVVSRLRDSTVLSSFWSYTFPRGAADLPAWTLRRAVDLVDDPLRLSVWPLALALLTLGTYRLARARPHGLLVAGAGIPIAVAAAAVSAYPFASRLALWIVPLAAIGLAAVLPSTLERAWPVLLAAATLTVVVAPSAATSLPQVAQVFHVEELRPVMEQVARERQPGDLVLVDIPAKAPFDFYTPYTGLGRDGVILFATTEEVGGRCNDPIALRTGRFATQRVWVVFAHRLADGPRLGTREDLLARILDVTHRSRTIDADGAMAILFDPTAPAGPVGTERRNPDRCLAVVRTVPPTG